MAGNIDVPETSVSSNNTSQKVFIRNDKINELVNDSDLNGGNFSEHSDDTCEINSPFSSSSEEEEVIQPEAGREHAGAFLNPTIQILSWDGRNKFRWFRNLHFPVYRG
jgi:hypothetical protein